MAQKQKGTKQESIIYGGFMGRKRGGGGSASGKGGGVALKPSIRYSKKSSAPKRQPVNVRYSPRRSRAKRQASSIRYSAPRRAAKRQAQGIRYSAPRRSAKRQPQNIRYSAPRKAARRRQLGIRYSPPSRAAKRQAPQIRYSPGRGKTKKFDRSGIRYSQRGMESGGGRFNAQAIRYSPPRGKTKKFDKRGIRYSPARGRNKPGKAPYGAPPRLAFKRKPVPPVPARQYPNQGGRFVGFSKAPRKKRTPQGPGAVFKGLLIVPGGIIAGFLQLRRKRTYKMATRMAGYQGDMPRQGNRSERLERQRAGYQGFLMTNPRKGPGAGTNYAGNLKVKKGQRRYSNPGRTYAGNLRMKREKGKLVLLLYQLRQLRFGLPVKPAAKYQKTSKAAKNYTGNFKLRKRGKDMHPSAAYLTTRRISSAGLRKAHRKWSIFTTRLFARKQQPKEVKRKTKKLRYDKNERDIWENWANSRSPETEAEPAIEAEEQD